VNCGHLRVYHAKGLPEGEFEESTMPCPYCRIRDLEAQLERCRAANVYDGNVHRRVSELEGFLHRMLPPHIEQSCDDCGGDLALCKSDYPDCPIRGARNFLATSETKGDSNG
jgi:hypothetical protein